MQIELQGLKQYIGDCCKNSFVIVDCRGHEVNREEKVAFSMSNIEKHGVDTALFINDAEGFSASINVFERDGSESDSCGNGMLLISHFLGLKTGSFKMKESVVSLIGDEVRQAVIMDLKFGSVVGVGPEHHSLFVKMGEPHLIYLVDDVQDQSLDEIGDAKQKDFPSGVNVDLLEKVNDTKYLIRTYERGIFGETKSCGTGSLSSYLAISFIHNKIYEEPIQFVSAGGIHWVSRIENKLRLETLKSFCNIRNLN